MFNFRMHIRIWVNQECLRNKKVNVSLLPADDDVLSAVCLPEYRYIASLCG